MADGSAVATPPPAFDAMRGDLAATVATLLRELDGLGRIVAETRAQMAALRADQQDAVIPTATDELAAVVEHTAAATHEILDTCETLEALASGTVADNAERLQAATTRIYEACAFQDITGQRIAKVVSALQAIEERVTKARASMGSETAIKAAAPHEAAVAKPVANDGGKPDLLNGPQMPGNAISQSAIDALFD